MKFLIMKEETMRINIIKNTTRCVSKIIGVILCVALCSAMETIQNHEEQGGVIHQNNNQFTLIREMIKIHVHKYPELFLPEKFGQQYDGFLNRLDVLVNDKLLLRAGDDEDQINIDCYSFLKLIEEDYRRIDTFSSYEQKDSNALNLEYYFKGMYLSNLYQVKACEVIVQETEILSKKYFSSLERESRLFQEGKAVISSEGIQLMIPPIERLRDFLNDYSDFLLEILKERKRFMVVIDDIYDICQVSKSLCLEKYNIKDSLFRLSNTIVMGSTILENRKKTLTINSISMDKICEAGESTDETNTSFSVTNKTTEKRNLMYKRVSKTNVLPEKTSSSSPISKGGLIDYPGKKNFRKSSSADDGLYSKEQNWDIKKKNIKEKKDKKEKK